MFLLPDFYILRRTVRPRRHHAIQTLTKSSRGEGGKDWDQLNRNRRVKEIEINLQMKARHIGELVRTNFPELRNADLTRYFFNVRLHAGANIIELLSSRIQPLR